MPFEILPDRSRFIDVINRSTNATIASTNANRRNTKALHKTGLLGNAITRQKMDEVSRIVDDGHKKIDLLLTNNSTEPEASKLIRAIDHNSLKVQRLAKEIDKDTDILYEKYKQNSKKDLRALFSDNVTIDDKLSFNDVIHRSTNANITSANANNRNTGAILDTQCTNNTHTHQKMDRISYIIRDSSNKINLLLSTNSRATAARLIEAIDYNSYMIRGIAKEIDNDTQMLYQRRSINRNY